MNDAWGGPHRRDSAEIRTPVAGPGEWLIGLSSWVLQDGNYPEFAVGEKRRFALEFSSDHLVSPVTATRSAHPLGDARYEVSAEVVVGESSLTVLDFGLLAYSDSRPEPFANGEWRSGTIRLDIDCFSYFERHGKRDDVPPAVYSWTITGLWLQTATYVPGVFKKMKMLVRDQSRLGWEWLDQTAAWSDDEGHAEYLLRCHLEEDPTVRHP